MKYNKLYSFLILLSSFCFLNTKLADQVPAYSLKFKIMGLKQGDTIYLANYYGDKQYLKDTAYVGKAGDFTFEGKEKLPGGIYLVVLPGKQYFEVIVSEQKFAMETSTKDYTKNMVVKGSTENTAFYNYLKYIVEKGSKAESLRKTLEKTKSEDSLKTLRESLNAVELDIFNYRKDFITKNPNLLVSKIFNAMMEPEIPVSIPADSTLLRFRYYKNHYWDNIDLNDDRLIRTPIFHGKLEKYIKQLTIQIPDSINKEADFIIGKIKDKKGELFKYCVWYITNQYETSQIMGMDAVFVHMAEKYYLTGDAYWINEDVENKIRDRYNTLRYLLLNTFAPPLSLPDSSGKNRSFSSIKSKYTVLFFWDPNCGHCQKETPKLHEIYLESKDKVGFEVYAINTQTEPNAWKNFIKSNKLSWINVWDPQHTSGFHKTYDIYSTPTMYILDEQKRIIGKRIGVDQLVEFLENYSKFKAAGKK